MLEISPLLIISIFFYARELLVGEGFTLIVPQKKIISSFNNQLDLVVMLELGVDILFFTAKAKPSHVD